MSTYAEFLAARAQANTGSGFEPSWLPDWLFGFQADVTGWAVRQGRSALFLDCGMGKTPAALVWAENVRRHTGRPVLVLTFLAVAAQFEREAAKFGVDAAVSRDGSRPAGVTIANYERLDRFDPADFGGVVCDESSAIKAFDGQTRAAVTEFLRTVPYRLLDTATAAPNDYVELGTSSEALGYLGHMDMLSRFFTNRERTSIAQGNTKTRWKPTGSDPWRFKGHAETPFWRWVTSWARAARRPSDLGYPDTGFTLPELRVAEHLVDPARAADGVLFDIPAAGLREEREEARRTLTERCQTAAALLDHDQPGIAWCHLNAEGDLLAKLIPGAVQVAGNEPAEAKEEKLLAFSAGQIRALVTKPAIGAWGLNWQHCHRMTYFPSHSYEQWYQAVRRCWRFGQDQPVQVDVITTPGGRRVLANLQRKADQADRMFTSLVAHMRDAHAVYRDDRFDTTMEVPAWLAS